MRVASSVFILRQVLDMVFSTLILSTVLQNYPHLPARSETLTGLSKITQLMDEEAMIWT